LTRLGDELGDKFSLDSSNRPLRRDKTVNSSEVVKGDMNRERGEDANWNRRAVLRGIAALTGTVVGSGSAFAEKRASDRSIGQQVDTSLPPGVTLFDLDGDGKFDATVERAPAEMQDESHPGPIHVTSGGRSTVDYAASIAEPPEATTLGDLDELSYEYYERPDDGSGEGTDDGSDGESVDGPDGGASGPGETFLVVENDDGRHGMYLTADAAEGAGGQWQTLDVLARVQDGSSGSNGWFEYTEVESGYDGQRFGDAVSRFGVDARLVRVGVGRGDAVTPTTLDAFYDNLTVDGETGRFPDSVANRVSNANPF
jgi:hypothetical protein